MNEMDFKTQPLGHGVYEMAYVKERNALFAASSPSFDEDKRAGVVFELAADTLRIDKKIPTNRRVFSAALDEESHILYLGNALDGSVTLLDSRTGKELRTLQLSDDAVAEKKPMCVKSFWIKNIIVYMCRVSVGKTKGCSGLSIRKNNRLLKRSITWSRL
ncbi:YncE family protein, partial [Type-E symbiont of Plautia stali]|uniref:YncE family protein n=1 Tax=Type-E symbiont of Plautia stali TaxID=1560357 RepID=UPI0035B6373B